MIYFSAEKFFLFINFITGFIMKILHIFFRLLGVVALVGVTAVGLVACFGGSSASENKKEVVRNLPPEPAFWEKDKTVLGVDTNNNGVRDDAERKLSDLVPLGENGDDAEYQKDLAALRATQNFIVEYEAGKVKTRGDVIRLYSLASCEGGSLIWNTTKDAINTEVLVFDTPERQEVFAKINRLLGGGIWGGETNCPTKK
jgi:hypothetical protein